MKNEKIKSTTNSVNMKKFEELVTPIYKDLYRFICFISKDQNISDDVFQNTLLNAYKSFTNLRAEQSFKSWLFSIAKRETINLLKKYKRDTNIEDTKLEFVLDESILSPEELIISKEMRQALTDAINQLNKESQEIVLLRYFNELSFEEISGILNLNYSTVRTKHMRAKASIKYYLKESYKNI